VQSAPGLALRAIDAFEGLSSSAVLDRLIRGRAWIGLLAFALIGMVTMQLLVLKLNTGIGHTLTRVAQLQRENAQLGIEDSASSAESRIAPLAVSAGMTLAPVGTVHFVAASPAYVTRAAAALSNPVQPSSGSQTAQASSVESQATGSEAATSSPSSSSSTATADESSSSEPQGSVAAAETGSSTESSTATSSPQE
jgi:cell division protein FtsL